ncbi:hypothetical protein K1T71_015139 [Dendrolimus kikuchii]|nr:hypothetical protein K1T71_015139 [Dendrolimus kikuchii]
MTMFRTKLIIILTITNLILTKCDDEKTNIDDETEILRNAERPEDIEIAKPKDNEGDDQFLEDDNTDKEDVNTRIDSYENIDTNSTVDDFSTTETPEVAPEAQSLKHNEESSEEEYLENITRRREEDVNQSAEVTETEPPQETTKAVDEIDTNLKAPESDEDQDIPGQRNPKNENSEPNNVIDKSNHDDQIRRPLTPPSKSTTLKGWLEDSLLRPPSGLLVPLRPMALNRALAVWNDLTVGGLNVSDIVIAGYDSNGINWRSRHSLKPVTSGRDRDVSEALSKLLLKYQGVNTDSASDGTMRALASAAKLVPYDSALFVITDKGAADPQRLPLALRTLVEKRLKVYTIWTDPSYPSTESELALQELRNISQYTEGEVLPYSMQVNEVDSSSNLASEIDQEWNTLSLKKGRRGRLNPEADYDRFDTLLVRRGGGEAISLGLPVENGVLALKVYIEGAVEHAVLYPPNEAPQIDLYNTTSVAAFSPASRTDGLNPRDVYLVFPGAKLDVDMLSVLPANPAPSEGQTSMVGVWHLSVKYDTCDYRLCVTARSHIHFDVETDSDEMLKFRIIGPVASVRESLLVDEYGTELAKLPFRYQPIAGDEKSEQIDPSTELVANVPLPSVKGSKVYAKIVGRDIRGEPFVRLSGPLPQPEVRMGRSASIVFPDNNDLERAEAYSASLYQMRINDTNALPYSRAVSQTVNQRGSLLTVVQIGLSSRLYGAPGDNLQLHFEVTNYREQSVRFTFQAVGELRFLTGINPTSQVIAPGQTTNVIVSLTISSTAQPNARDLITFTAYGQDQVSISAYVYVTNAGEVTSDVWAPEVRHNFQGTCIGRMGEDCSQHIWSATIIARDALGGLLCLTSSPPGLAYDSNFISGTREEVTATYRATCCAPRMLVNAVDSFGNTNSYIVDISYYFTAAGIAAIVLGVILAIALLALLIFLIHWCVKRRRESRELPYSTSSRNIS